MNYKELKEAIKYIQKSCKCLDCKKSYTEHDIFIIATTSNEALFELKCHNCGLVTIITMINQKNDESSIQKSQHNLVGHRPHNGVSQNDVLDVKNFLNHFDGNFKKFFKSKK